MIRIEQIRNYFSAQTRLRFLIMRNAYFGTDGFGTKKRQIEIKQPQILPS